MESAVKTLWFLAGIATMVMTAQAVRRGYHMLAHNAAGRVRSFGDGSGPPSLRWANFLRRVGADSNRACHVLGVRPWMLGAGERSRYVFLIVGAQLLILRLLVSCTGSN